MAVEVAHAQSLTTGAIEGRVVDVATSQPIDDATVVLTAGRDVRSALSDRDGRYHIAGLVPDEYVLRFFDGAGHGVERRGIVVHAFTTIVVNQAIDRSSPGMVQVESPGSAIDPTSAALTTIADRGLLAYVPRTPLTWETALGLAPGAAGDGYGIAFADATSLDNRYVVDGIDTTDPYNGYAISTALPLDLVRELAIITGGYSADYGRGVGGLASVVTRHGTNEFHGSVFGAVAPGFLQAAAKRDPAPPQTIDVRGSPTTGDIGVELGGPIVKDRAWFWIAFAPQLSRIDYTRTIQAQTDCRKVQPDGSLSLCRPEYADGQPDIDPRTGYPIVAPVASETRVATYNSFPIVAKIDAALASQHDGSITAILIPSSSSSPGLYGAASTGSRTWGLTADTAARWTSRFRDDTTRVDATVGWHHVGTFSGSYDPALDNTIQTQTSGGDLSKVAAAGGESPTVASACAGGPFVKCPLASYAIGGPGALLHDTADRAAVDVAVTQRVRAAGTHDLEIGVTAIDEQTGTARVYSGGALQFDTLLERYVNLAAPGDPDPRFDQTCSTATQSFRCQVVGGTPGAPGTIVDAESQVLGAYARDTWRPIPNVVIDASARIERERLRYPHDLQNAIDPLTGERLGTVALAPSAHIAPRVAVAYDPTEQGRAKLFVTGGRYFETLGTQIVAQEFSRGAVQSTQLAGNTSTTTLFAGNRERVAGGLRDGYVNELVAGAEYEVIPRLVGSVAFVHRELNRTIEDVLLDAQTYVIANPGEGVAGAVDSPSRRYDALVLDVSRRFSTRLALLASYTYSRTVGNYQGTIDYDHANATPHLTAQYDLIELLANQAGPLPQDRPHYVKLDGYYTVPISARDTVVLGVRVRALSGTPISALGGHFLYGSNASYLLPRGSLGRTPFTSDLDLRVAYRCRLTPHTSAEIYVDLANIFDSQDPLVVDQGYTQPLSPSRAVVGGSYSDLIWLKQSDFAGKETSQPVTRNTSFGKPTSRYAPTSAAIGARVTF